MRWIALAAGLVVLNLVVFGWMGVRDRGDMSPPSPRAVAIVQGQRLDTAQLPPDGRDCPECPIRVIGPTTGGRWLLAHLARDGRTRCYTVPVGTKAVFGSDDAAGRVRRADCPQRRTGAATGG